MSPVAAKRLPTCIAASAGMVLLALTVARAQTPAPRDQPSRTIVPAAEATGVIRGRILAAPDNQPLREADVRLSGASLREPLFLVTDAEGRYAFEGLPPGAYTVAAFKTGRAERSYGQRRWADLPASLDLRAGETVVADIRLPLTGAIVVRLFSPAGEPIVGLQVSALSKRFHDGQPAFTVMGGNINALTDDRGEVRLFGLHEGDYYVVARPANLMPLQRPPREGETFYPGVRTSDRAMPVRVAAGSETLITFAVEPVARLSTISGVIVDSSGAPANGATVSMTLHASARTAGVRVDRFPDGSFVTAPLAPGDYLMQVRAGGGGGPAEYVSHRFHVVGEDIRGAVLRTRPGATVTGRITLDEPGARLDPRALRLQVAPVVINERPMSTGSATVNDDWSFEIGDLMARGALRVAEPTGQWWIKSVWIDGRDVSDVPVDFRAGTSFRDVQVLLTRRAAQMNGVVAGAVPGTVIVVFPTDPELWTPTTRRIAVATPDDAGQFVVGGLPAGDYHVIALDGLQRGAERDVDTLTPLAGRALTVHLAEGESKSLRLEVVDR